MKEQPWDSNTDANRDFVESGVLAVGDEVENEPLPVSSKNRVTELRRKIEERLDSKRIAREIDNFDMDDYSDSLQ